MRIHIIGDSTAASKVPDKRPETGWGEKVQSFLPSGAVVLNHAINGRSTRSFYEEGNWHCVKSSLQPGDFLFIQFGHNDQKREDPSRFTKPFSSFQMYLRRYVEGAREKGATPVLLTPIVRRKFANGKFFADVEMPYYHAILDVAEKLSVPVLDLFKESGKIVAEAGEEKSREFYLHLASGVHPNYPDGIEDNTHFNAYGAEVFASEVASLFQNLQEAECIA